MARERFGANDLLRLTTGGQQTKLTGFSAAAGPRYLTKGPGNTLWVGLETKQKVARITGSHHIMRHPDSRGTTVPVHPGRDIRGERFAAFWQTPA